MRFFQLHELNIGGEMNYLHQLAIKAGSKFTLFLFLVKVLKSAVRFEQLFFQSYNGSDKEYIRRILLYEFNKGNNATESARNIKAVYGD